MNTRKIPLYAIREPEEAHRFSMDPEALRELADSMQYHGLINPITVKQVADGIYEVVAGHRRLTAAKLLRWEEIPASIIEADEGQTNIIKMMENMTRADLTPVEEARAVVMTMEMMDYDIEAVAKMMKRSAGWVALRADMAQWPDDVLDLLQEKEISIAVGKELARITEDAHRRYLCSFARGNGVSASTALNWRLQWEIDQERADPEERRSPQQIIESGPIIVMVPCTTCGDSTDINQTEILRVCKPCANEVKAAISQST